MKRISKAIERNIAVGMIVSDDYLRQVRPIYDSKFLIVSNIRKLCNWCVEYFDKYGQAPNKDIQQIFYDKLQRKKLSQDDGEEIEELLDNLSDEYDRERFNVKYVLEQTQLYFDQRKLEDHNEEVQRLLDVGEIEEANKLIEQYTPPKIDDGFADILDLSEDNKLKEAVKQAFEDAAEPLFTYPGAYGEMINEHLVRAGFVAFFAPEKRGKTFNFLDLAMRACKQGCNVAFFQAGDMTTSQQIRRMSINRARKNDKIKYVGEQWIPQKDCIHNQLDTCSKKIRECTFGVFNENEVEDRNKVTKKMLMDAYEENPDYLPCHNCKEFNENNWGTPWLVKKDLGDPLTEQEAYQALKQFFVDQKKRFKLASYANGTLTIKEIENQLNEWDKEGFIVDVVIIDYADLLVDNSIKEERHAQNKIWKELRGLSQKRHALIISASQTDANSYEQDTIGMKNFSEDKRKLGHATAVLGLNQDRKGREKELGVLRANEIALREGDLSVTKQVNILQSLKQGQFFLTSYW